MGRRRSRGRQAALACSFPVLLLRDMASARAAADQMRCSARVPRLGSARLQKSIARREVHSVDLPLSSRGDQLLPRAAEILNGFAAGRSRRRCIERFCCSMIARASAPAIARAPKQNQRRLGRAVIGSARSCMRGSNEWLISQRASSTVLARFAAVRSVPFEARIARHRMAILPYNSTDEELSPLGL